MLVSSIKFQSDSTKYNTDTALTETLTKKIIENPPSLASADPPENKSVLHFNGAGDRIALESNNLSYALGENLTLSAWVQPYYGTGDVQSIISKHYLDDTGAADPCFIFELQADGRNIQFGLGRAGYTAASTGPILTLNEWALVTATYNDLDGLKIYVNGVEKGSNPASVDYSGSYAPVIIGGHNYSADRNPFNGLMDDVRIYKESLNSTQVNQLYNGIDPGVSNLVVHYDFDQISNGIVDDLSADNNDGTIIGADEVIHNTRNFGLGRSLRFDANNDMITISDSDSLKLGNNLTLSAWIKPMGNTGDNQGIVGKCYDNDVYIPSYYLYLDPDGRTAVFALWTPTGIAVTSPFRLSFDSWYFIVGTYNNIDGMKLYINGAEVGSRAGSVDYSTTSAPVIIGAFDSQSDQNYFNGFIDDVRIYNDSLTSNEINQLLWGNNTRSQNLLLYHDFEEISEPDPFAICNDQSNFNNDGYIKGAREVWYNGAPDFKLETALSFDGVDDEVYVANDSSLIFGNNLTLSAWIKPMGTNGDHQTIIGKLYDDDIPDLCFGLNTEPTGRTLEFYIENGGGTILLQSPIPIDFNFWYFVTATYDNVDGQKLYINGEEVSSNPNLATFATGNAPIIVGSNNCSWNRNPFYGLIDNPQIRNQSLTSDQIKQLYHNSSLYIGGNLLINFNFEQVTDGVAVDQSSYEQNGTINGALEVLVQYPPNTPVLATISPSVDTDGTVKVDWNDIPDAMYYQLFRDTNIITDVSTLNPIATRYKSNYTDEGLNSGTYFYAVRAFNGSCKSALSENENVMVSIPSGGGAVIPRDDDDDDDDDDDEIEIPITIFIVIGLSAGIGVAVLVILIKKGIIGGSKAATRANP